MTIELDDATISAARDLALSQLEFARRYNLELLENTPQDRWFEIPEGAPTNIAWQVGHLAYSQYGLLMFRLRGREPEDLDLIPSTFRKKYGRGTTPIADPEKLHPPEELMARLAAVNEQAIATVKASPLDAFREEIDLPYAVYPNKLGAVLFCPLHEQIHSGQIGLVRRLLGYDPVR